MPKKTAPAQIELVTNTMQSLEIPSRTSTPASKNRGPRGLHSPQGEETRVTPEREKFSVFECGKYTLFLVLFTMIAIIQKGSGESSYLVTKQIRSLLVEQGYPNDNDNDDTTFYDIIQPSDMWHYLREIVVPVYLPEACESNGEGTCPANDAKMIAQQNSMMGGFEVRMIRVRTDKCYMQEVNEDLTSLPACSAPYSMQEEMKDDIEIPAFGSRDSEILQWTDYRTEYNGEMVREGDPAWASLKHSYADTGYRITFPKTTLQADAIEHINQLEAGGYFDSNTRLLVVDATFYNANLNVHTLARSSFEMTPAGGVEPSLQVKTWRFARYSGTMGNILTILWYVFISFVGVFTLEEFYEMIVERCGYFKSFWNYLDILNLVGFYSTIFINMYTAQYEVELAQARGFGVDHHLCYTEADEPRECANLELRELMFTDLNMIQNFRFLQFQFIAENYFVFINGFLLWIKMFKYMTFSARIRFLIDIITRSASELFFFTVVMLVVILAFAMSGYLMFSSDVHIFRSFDNAVINLFIAFVGDGIDYEELYLSAGSWGGLYYIMWNLSCTLILVNVFIAILCEAYSAVTEDMEDEQATNLLQGVFGGIKKRFSMFGLGRMFGNKVNITHDDADADGDGDVDATDLQKKLSIDSAMANDMVKRFDRDGDGQLSADEYEELRGAAEKQHSALQSARGSRRLQSKLASIEEALMTLAQSTHQNFSMGEDEESTKTIVKLALKNFKAEMKNEIKAMKDVLQKEVASRCQTIARQIRTMDERRDKRFRQLSRRASADANIVPPENQRYFDLFMLKEKFAELDSTNDGGIELSEFRRAIQELQLAVPSILVEKLFHSLDKNGDGCLDLDEFVAMIENSSRLKPEDDFKVVFKNSITKHLAEYHLSPRGGSRPISRQKKKNTFAAPQQQPW